MSTSLPCRWYATRGTALVDLLAIGPLPLELALWLAPSAPHSWSSALPLVLMLRLARLVHVWRFLVDAQFNGIQLYRGFGLYSVVTPTALLLANLTFTTATVVSKAASWPSGCALLFSPRYSLFPLVTHRHIVLLLLLHSVYIVQ